MKYENPMEPEKAASIRRNPVGVEHAHLSIQGKHFASVRMVPSGETIEARFDIPEILRKYNELHPGWNGPLDADIKFYVWDHGSYVMRSYHTQLNSMQFGPSAFKLNHPAGPPILTLVQSEELPSGIVVFTMRKNG